jgi:hypothetical protein
VIWGYGGNDSIFGLAGDDYFLGGTGADALHGGIAPIRRATTPRPPASWRA